MKRIILLLMFTFVFLIMNCSEQKELDNLLCYEAGNGAFVNDENLNYIDLPLTLIYCDCQWGIRDTSFMVDLRNIPIFEMNTSGINSYQELLTNPNQEIEFVMYDREEKDVYYIIGFQYSHVIFNFCNVPDSLRYIDIPEMGTYVSFSGVVNCEMGPSVGFSYSYPLELSTFKISIQ